MELFGGVIYLVSEVYTCLGSHMNVHEDKRVVKFGKRGPIPRDQDPGNTLIVRLICQIVSYCIRTG